MSEHSYVEEYLEWLEEVQKDGCDCALCAPVEDPTQEIHYDWDAEPEILDDPVPFLSEEAAETLEKMNEKIEEKLIKTAQQIEAAIFSGDVVYGKGQSKTNYFTEVVDDLNGGEEQVEYLTPEKLKEAMDEVKASGYTPSPPSPWTQGGYLKTRPLRQLVPNLYSTEHKVKCPLGEVLCDGREAKVPYDIASIIIHLNDGHEWSRSEIADWLDSLDVDLSFKKPDEDEGGEQ